MKSQRKRLLSLLSLSLIPIVLFPVKLAMPLFPLGLTLTYQITDDVYSNWTEQYEILYWAPELGASVLVIDHSSSKGLGQHDRLYVNISSWTLLLDNGSETGQYLQFPLWMNTSLWRIGDTIQIPAFTGEYYLSQVLHTTVIGTFTCWQARSVAWFSVDDDYQLTSEHWYFHDSLGILLKYSNELLPSQHAIYTYTFTRVLTTSNLMNYGIFSLEEQIQFVVQSLGIMLALFLPIIFVRGLIAFYYNRIGKCR